MARSGSVSDATAHLRRRRSQRRRRRWVALAWLLGATVLLSGVAYLFYGSPAFVARQVRVEGATLLSSDQVRAQAAVPQVPLARVDTDEVAARVDALPEVGSARVRVRFPSSVLIEVVERTPAVQRVAGSRFQWVDAEGVVFHERSARLPSVVVVRTPDTDQRLLADSATIAQNLTATLRAQVVQLEASSPDTFVLVLKGGRRVVWGSAAESGTKAQVATALLSVKATVYDVSSPSTPTSR